MRKVVLSKAVADITEIEFREPVYKDMMDFEIPTDGKFQMGTLLKLGFRLSNVPEAILEEISYNDTLKVVEIVSSFLNPG